MTSQVSDNFAPRIVDGLAAPRHVIAFNYRGGGSSGQAPLSVAEMARDVIEPMREPGLKQIDPMFCSLPKTQATRHHAKPM